jgi:hypothetical protein
MARILAAEDLLDEARDAIRDSILSAGRVIAGRARLPEPESLEEVLLPPLGARWEDDRPLIQDFLESLHNALEPLLYALQKLALQPPGSVRQELLREAAKTCKNTRWFTAAAQRTWS